MNKWRASQTAAPGATAQAISKRVDVLRVLCVAIELINV